MDERVGIRGRTRPENRTLQDWSICRLMNKPKSFEFNGQKDVRGLEATKEITPTAGNYELRIHFFFANKM